MVALLAATSCDAAEQVLSPTDYSGQYALTSVNGRDLGWFDYIAGADCQVAYTSGLLVITDKRQFRLVIDYDLRCFGTDPFDGHDNVIVVGTDIKPTETNLVLNGVGPDMIGGRGFDRWSIDVRPIGANVEMTFFGFNGEFFADPVFVLGPREPYTGPCFIGC